MHFRDTAHHLLLILNPNFFEYSTFSSIFSCFVTFYLVQVLFSSHIILLLIELPLRNSASKWFLCFLLLCKLELRQMVFGFYWKLCSMAWSRSNVELIFSCFTFYFRLFVLFPKWNTISVFQTIISSSFILLLEDSLWLKSSIPFVLKSLHLFKLIVLASPNIWSLTYQLSQMFISNKTKIFRFNSKKISVLKWLVLTTGIF